MAHSQTIPIGIILARKALNNPWIDHVWKPIGIALEFPKGIGWKKLSVTKDETHYLASAELELYRAETDAYFVNINDREPSTYVVLRDREEADDNDTDESVPLEIHLVTASPYEAQDYLDTGEDIVERIPMPEALVEQVKQFIAEHHKDEKFRKRKRDNVDVEEHKFGQEPIFITRRHRKGSEPDDGKK